MAHKIFFQDLNQTIEVLQGKTILEAAEQHGVEIPSSCRSGNCGTCKIKRVLGDVYCLSVGTETLNKKSSDTILSCVTYPKSDLVCETLSGEDIVIGKVMAIINQTPDTKSFQLGFDDKNIYEFVPGQFLTVIVPINDKKQYRCYSISSSNMNKKYMEITIKRQKNGLVSNYFHDLVKVGDVITVKKAKGDFVLNMVSEDNIVMVCSGSGITPCISMLRTLNDMKSQRKVLLIYGSRSEKDIIFHQNLLELQQINPNISIKFILSQPSHKWKGQVGRISEEMVLETLQFFHKEVSLYTCGVPKLMETAVKSAINYGLEQRKIFKEQFAPPKKPLPLNSLTLERMKAIEIFNGLSDTILKNLQPHVSLRKFRANELIFREGEYGNSAFFILEGSVKIFLTELDRKQIGHRPVRKKSFWKQLIQPFKKRPEGYKYILVNDVKDAKGSFNRDGVSCDREGKSFNPFYLPDLTFDSKGNVIESNEFIFLEKGEIFGELAALFRSPRNATVVSASKKNHFCTALQIKVQGLRILTKQKEEFNKFIRERYRQRSLMQFFKDSDLFADCDPILLSEILRCCSFYSLKPKEVVCLENEPSNEFFFVLSGFLRISKSVENRDLNINYLKKGDFFGELGLLQNKKRNSKVTAVNNAQVIGLSEDIFEKLMAIESVRKIILKEADFRMRAIKSMETMLTTSSLLNFGINQDLINGKSIMVIDLDRCTRCDDCVKACADSHEGYPRFSREGPKFDNMMFPQSCMHCLDPLCMDGCPSGALHRAVEKGEVIINVDTCIGCEECVQNCVYGNIVSLPVGWVSDKGKFEHLRNPETRQPMVKAMKCDLCVDTGKPACISACSHDALRRLSFDEIFRSQCIEI